MRSCSFIRAEGRIWVPRPNSWLGGWARHSWLKRHFGNDAPLSIACPETWHRLATEGTVKTLTEEKNKLLKQVLDNPTKIAYNGIMKKSKQPLEVGDHVSYSVDTTCTGIILEIKETLIKVKWFYHDVAEWMPHYSLEITNELP